MSTTDENIEATWRLLPSNIYGCFWHEICGNENCSKVAKFLTKLTSYGRLRFSQKDFLITGDESWLYFHDYKNAPYKIVARMGKNAGISVLYMSGVTLKGTR